MVEHQGIACYLEVNRSFDEGKKIRSRL